VTPPTLRRAWDGCACHKGESVGPDSAAYPRTLRSRELRLSSLVQAALPLAVAACLSDPVGPGTLVVRPIAGSLDSIWVGAPGEPLGTGVRLQVTDGSGLPVPGATVGWQAVGRGAQVLDAGAQTDAQGNVRGGWLLGTDAAQEQMLNITVRTAQHESAVTIRARAVPHVVTRVQVAVDTPAVLRVGDTLALVAQAVDPYGNVFPAPNVQLAIGDSTIGRVTSSIVVGGPRRGRTVVIVMSEGVQSTLALHVTQYVAKIVPAVDTFRFTSLGAELPVSYSVVDDRGKVVADTQATITVLDTAVAQVAAGHIQSVSVGSTSLRYDVVAVSRQVSVLVRQRVASVQFHRDTAAFDALLDTTTLHPVAKDSLGSVVPQPALRTQVADTTTVRLIAPFLLRSLRPGATTVQAVDSETGITGTLPVVVQQKVTAIDVGPNPVLFDALKDTVPLTITPRDRLGSPVDGARLQVTVADTQVVTTLSGNRLRSIAPGTTTASVRDSASGISAGLTVTVTQRVARIVSSLDSLLFSALADSARVSANAYDRLGSRIAAPVLKWLSADSRVAVVDSSGLVRARSQGTNAVVVHDSFSAVADTVRVHVWQQPVALSLHLATQPTGFTFTTAGDSLGVVESLDRNGFRLPASRISTSVSDTSVVQVDSLGVIRAYRSGVGAVSSIIDTFTVTGSLAVVLPVQVLTQQEPGFQITGWPDTAFPGPVTVIPKADGTVWLYSTGYAPDSTQSPPFSGDLFSASSTDGVHFTFAGVALTRDTAYRREGIESVFIVPRDDGVGCRMYAAAGKSHYMWQVYSAIADDCTSWTWEDGAVVPGVQASDGTLRGTGEGIYAWQDSVGAWWMLVGAMSTLPNDYPVWTVALYRANSERQWQFVRTVFRPGPPGSGTERAVFAPTVVQVAPGLYRMFYSGDDLGVGPNDGRSRIMSAVSRDRFNWTPEGVVLDFGINGGGPAYPSVVGNRLYYQYRNPYHSGLYLSAARIAQP